MNSEEGREYRSVERRMIDSRARFIIPAQVSRCRDTNTGKYEIWVGQILWIGNAKFARLFLLNLTQKCAFSEPASV